MLPNRKLLVSLGMTGGSAQESRAVDLLSALDQAASSTGSAAKQIEAITLFPRLLALHSDAVTVNSACLKLADVFANAHTYRKCTFLFCPLLIAVPCRCQEQPCSLRNFENFRGIWKWNQGRDRTSCRSGYQRFSCHR